MSATGKPEETAFYKYVLQHYRRNVDIQRLSDSFDAGKLVEARPSDFMITFGPDRDRVVPLGRQPRVVYAEVKSSSAAKNWPYRSALSDSQWRGMRKAQLLELPYLVALCLRNQWYLLPATQLLEWKEEGKRSLTHEMLVDYIWANVGNLHEQL